MPAAVLPLLLGLSSPSHGDPDEPQFHPWPEGDTGGWEEGPAPTSPVAAAGDDLTAAPGASVRLDGSWSHDPEGEPLLFSWSQAAGPEALLEDSGAAVATALLPEEGTYVFRLEVQDPQGGTGTDLVMAVARADAQKSGCSHAGAGHWLLGLLLIRRRKEGPCQPSSAAIAGS